MENHRRLILWALAHQKRLGIEVFDYSWPRQFGVQIFDYGARVNFRGRNFETRGTSLDRETALTIVFSEIFERLALCLSDAPDSNGFSCHLDAESAKATAEREIIERDAIIISHFGGLPLRPLVLPGSQDDFRIAALWDAISILRDSGVDVRSFIIAETGPYLTVKTYFDGSNAFNKFGLVFGFGCSSDLTKALVSSLMEGIGAAFWALSTPNRDTLSPTEFANKSQWEIEDHIKLTLSIDYAEEYKQTVEARMSDKEASLPFEPGKVTTLNLGLCPTEFPDFPGIVMRSTSDYYQRPFWGLHCLSHFNAERLRKSDIHLNEQMLNSILPHPLG